jgi:hypothetical protein
MYSDDLPSENLGTAKAAPAATSYATTVIWESTLTNSTGVQEAMYVQLLHRYCTGTRTQGAVLGQHPHQEQDS